MNRALNYIALIMALLYTYTAMAALPPLDDRERELFASHIVEGEVLQRSSITVEDHLGTKKNFRVQFEITKVIKGSGVTAKQTIEVIYWKAGKRPERWVGDTGQRSLLTVGKSFTLFLNREKSGDRYKLLHPNGSSPLKAPLTPTSKIYSWRGISIQYPESWELDDRFKSRISIWPPEGEQPLMSNITVEPKHHRCEALEGLKKKLIREIETYFDSELINDQPVNSGRGFELVYSWKDNQLQQQAFINHDRYLCGNHGGIYLVRFASIENEYQHLIQPAKSIFDSLKLEDTINHEQKQ